MTANRQNIQLRDRDIVNYVVRNGEARYLHADGSITFERLEDIVQPTEEELRERRRLNSLDSDL